MLRVDSLQIQNDKLHIYSKRLSFKDIRWQSSMKKFRFFQKFRKSLLIILMNFCIRLKMFHQNNSNGFRNF